MTQISKFNHNPDDVYDAEDHFIPEILETIFSFLSPFPCWPRYQRVCKSWHRTIETVFFKRQTRIHVHLSEYFITPSGGWTMSQVLTSFLSKFDPQEVKTVVLSCISLNEEDVSLLKQFSGITKLRFEFCSFSFAKLPLISESMKLLEFVNCRSLECMFDEGAAQRDVGTKVDSMFLYPLERSFDCICDEIYDV